MLEVDFRTPFLDVAQGQLDFAEEMENLGYGCYWHAHSVGRDFRRLDTLMMMAGIAARTNRIKLGTAVLQAVLYAPVALARILMTLDHLSNGRVILGVGTGWVPKEFANLGVPFEERGGRTDEALEILQRLWTEEEVTYEGRYYTIREARLTPQPVQRPHPRILIGGVYRARQRSAPGQKGLPEWSQRALRRVVAHGDGWIVPSSIEPENAAEVLAQGLEMIKALGREMGRTITDERFELVAEAGAFTVHDNREQALKEAKDAYMSRVAGGFYQVMGNPSFDEMVANGAWVCGSAEDVAEFISRWLEVKKKVPALKRIQLNPASFNPIEQLRRFHAEVRPMIGF
ncbi:MAG: LLM class flavin-dependent oxidoreductase [Chloroflexi bacterium]|nr:LLM class flavin-dependent oxidoreductase [Chloroflexota bacterium]